MHFATNGLKNKQVKGAIGALFAIACGDIKMNEISTCVQRVTSPSRKLTIICRQTARLVDDKMCDSKLCDSKPKRRLTILILDKEGNQKQVAKRILTIIPNQKQVAKRKLTIVGVCTT